MEVGVRELRNHTTGVIDAVERGEDVVLTRHGVPIARIMPIAHEPDIHDWLRQVTDQGQDTGWLEELLAENDDADDTDDRRIGASWS
jgi:prevent-host-death family protein